MATRKEIEPTRRHVFLSDEVQDLSHREKLDVAGGHSLWETIKQEYQWQKNYGILSSHPYPPPSGG